MIHADYFTIKPEEALSSLLVGVQLLSCSCLCSENGEDKEEHEQDLASDEKPENDVREEVVPNSIEQVVFSPPKGDHQDTDADRRVVGDQTSNGSHERWIFSYSILS